MGKEKEDVRNGRGNEGNEEVKKDMIGRKRKEELGKESKEQHNVFFFSVYSCSLVSHHASVE